MHQSNAKERKHEKHKGLRFAFFFPVFIAIWIAITEWSLSFNIYLCINKGKRRQCHESKKSFVKDNCEVSRALTYLMINRSFSLHAADEDDNDSRSWCSQRENYSNWDVRLFISEQKNPTDEEKKTEIPWHLSFFFLFATALWLLLLLLLRSKKKKKKKKK